MNDYLQMLLDNVVEYDDSENEIPTSKANAKILDDAFQARLISYIKTEHPSMFLVMK